MPVHDSEGKIAEAVKVCIEEARGSRYPLAVLKRCAERHRADPDWSNREVAEFRLRVVEAMRQLGSDEFTPLIE